MPITGKHDRRYTVMVCGNYHVKLVGVALMVTISVTTGLNSGGLFLLVCKIIYGSVQNFQRKLLQILAGDAPRGDFEDNHQSYDYQMKASN